jgi:hypothetical protein
MRGREAPALNQVIPPSHERDGLDETAISDLIRFFQLLDTWDREASRAESMWPLLPAR